MTLPGILALGFLFGLRHATDSDHVVAVSTIVSRERSVRAAALLGAFWGIGHSLTLFVAGGVIIAFGLAVPARLGLSLELVVAAMLVVLGGMNLRREQRAEDRDVRFRGPYRSMVVGIVHGLAGSAAIALLVLSTIRVGAWAAAYLVLFGVGTMCGMALLTTLFAFPLSRLAVSAVRFRRGLVVATGIVSVTLGLVAASHIVFDDGLFSADPRWTPS